MVNLRDVSKRFGKCTALWPTAFNMAEGRVYGLWGRNGAGKTTMIRLIAGLLAPDEGHVEVLGRDPAKDWRIRRQIGLVEDGDAYFPELTVDEFLWWVGRLRSVDDDVCDSLIKAIAARLYLKEQLADEMGSLSHGMRRKTLLASAFIGRPKVILLDEPTTGLDVDSVDSLACLLEEHRGEGGTAVIACHDQGFVEKVCSDVIELDSGKIVGHNVTRRL